jgi:hypothetical protein
VLPKHIGINYFYWSKRMQDIFITKDLWELVTKGYDYPSNEEYKALDTNGKLSLKELVEKDEDNEALSLIGSAVDEPMFPRINAAKSCKEA